MSADPRSSDVRPESFERGGVRFVLVQNVTKGSFSVEVTRRIKRGGGVRLVIRTDAYSPVSGELRPKDSAVFVAEGDVDNYWRMVLPFFQVVDRLPSRVQLEFTE